jgi:hypothetical protein
MGKPHIRGRRTTAVWGISCPGEGVDPRLDRSYVLILMGDGAAQLIADTADEDDGVRRIHATDMACGDDDVLYLYLAHICATWMPVSISLCTFFGLICLTRFSIHSAEIGFQYNIAVLHLDFQIVMSFKPNFRCDTFRDSDRQTVTPLLRRRFLAPSSSVDMQ